MSHKLREDDTSGFRLKAIGIYFVLVLLVAGGLSGGMYRILYEFGVEDLDFGELSFRILQVTAMLGSIVLLSVLGQRGWSALGLTPSQRFKRELVQGLLLGLISLSLICGALLILDLRVIRPDLITEPSHWVQVVVRAALAAIVIAVIEEAWFRGALHNIFSSVLRVPASIVLIALFYAFMHFLRPDVSGLQGQPVELWSGYLALYDGLINIPLLGMQDSIVALFIVGMLLGLLRVRQGNIAMCIGMHMGWVFVIKVHKKFTYINPKADLNMLVGQYDGVLGWLAAGLLLVMTLVLWLPGWLPRSKSV